MNSNGESSPWSDNTARLRQQLLDRGFREDFCNAIAYQMNTDWTAGRMLGYLRLSPQLREEDIVDEMLGILEDRERIKQKKEMEYYQGKLNEFYDRGFEE